MAGNRWVRLDADYFTNPKTLAAGRDGRALHLASICWVARHLTDGHIPSEALDTILHSAGVKRSTVDAVVHSGLWTPNGVGYVVHDYLESNPSRADVEREREQWRQRQKRRRDQRGQFAAESGDVTP